MTPLQAGIAGFTFVVMTYFGLRFLWCSSKAFCGSYGAKSAMPGLPLASLMTDAAGTLIAATALHVTLAA